MANKEYQSSMSNVKTNKQDNSMDKLLLEDQEDITAEQKKLTKFYRQLKKQDLPDNDILLKIQKIRSGGKVQKEKQNKQMGLD